MTGQLPSSETDADVLEFIRLYRLQDTPVFLDYRDAGYGADWCHVSAKHHALTQGGRRVHGWALWQYPGLVMGDFHSVWQDRDDKLVDVTPPKFGADKVLFVRDRVCDIYEINGIFALPTNRSSNRNAPFWWMGNPTPEQVWGLQRAEPALVAYCNGLGFNLDTFVTQPGTG